MLVLSRNVGESILIGNDISISILGVVGKQIKIGVSAPSNLSVDREEIRNLKKQIEQHDLISLSPFINEGRN